MPETINETETETESETEENENDESNKNDQDTSIEVDIDSLDDSDLDNNSIVSGFLRHLNRWKKLTLVVVDAGKMQNKERKN